MRHWSSGAASPPYGAAGEVYLNVFQSATGTGYVGPTIDWGDGVTETPAWDYVYSSSQSLSKSHIYPDLATRTATITSDCCQMGGGPIVQTVQIDFACTDTPMMGCRQAGKAKLKIKNDPDDAKDKLSFIWGKGDATTKFEFGGNNLLSITQFSFCIYAPGLVLDAAIPPGSNWSSNAGDGKYSDKSGAAKGITKLAVKAGDAGKSKILIKGAGINLDDPLPLSQPVLVQVQVREDSNNIRNCWEHEFTSPETENTADEFKDKEP